MPYRWTETPDEIRLQAWPHRSLGPRGFVWFIGLTAVLLAAPLPALLGTPVLWGLLPFLLAALWAIWAALERSWRDGAILETLVLSQTEARLSRNGPGKRHAEWAANRHWVRPVLHPAHPRIPQYLTLQGGPREVELGAFLTGDERRALHADLSARLARR